MPRGRRINTLNLTIERNLHPVVAGLLAFNTTTCIFFYMYAYSNNECHNGNIRLHQSTHETIQGINEVLKKVIELK